MNHENKKKVSLWYDFGYTNQTVVDPEFKTVLLLIQKVQESPINPLKRSKTKASHNKKQRHTVNKVKWII